MQHSQGKFIRGAYNAAGLHGLAQAATNIIGHMHSEPNIIGNMLIEPNVILLEAHMKVEDGAA